MDIKQSIRQLQKLERDRMRAIQSGDARQEESCDEMIALIQDAVDAWVDMAETALEFVKTVRKIADAKKESSNEST